MQARQWDPAGSSSSASSAPAGATPCPHADGSFRELVIALAKDIFPLSEYCARSIAPHDPVSDSVNLRYRNFEICLKAVGGGSVEINRMSSICKWKL